MSIDVSRALNDPGQSFPFSVSVQIEPMEVLDDPVSFENVRAEGTFVSAGDDVSVEGTVKADVRTRCARCLCEIVFPETAPLDAFFARTPEPGNPDQRPLDGHTIDLTDSATEALLLELPMRSLCKRDCKGLCPVCGTNLNTHNCSCQEGGKRLNPFSALSGLLSKDEEV